MKLKTPYLFDEFFSSDRSETVSSPFLTPESRRWGKNLHLKRAILSAVLLALAFTFFFINQPVSMIFLASVYFLSGTPAVINSINDLLNLEINIEVLMTTAAFLAIAIDSGLEGALLLVLFELSHGMEHAVSDKARSALHNLNNIAPKFAYLIDESGNTYEKSVREIQQGEKVLIKNGEIIPLDGTVIEGTSSVNLVHLTGESIPISKTVGDIIPAGARNLEAALTISVTRTSSDSTLSRIVKLIHEAQGSKPHLQRWLDRFGQRYATTIIGLTFLFAIGLPFIWHMTYFGPEGSIYRALAFLIAASPCALIIATPTAYLSSISASARKGILLKGGVTLDALASCKCIAFDKTGTLTTGKLQCTTKDLPDEILFIAYGLERQVVHPIATAICQLAEEKKLPPAPIENFKAIPGYGVEGVVKGKKVKLGRPKTHEKEGVHAILEYDGKSYSLEFSDQIRKDIRKLIQKLPLKPIMLTGDHEKNAKTVGQAVGIDQIFASLHPEDKLQKVSEFSENGLAMVGDGINDAPALARATVGISMGKIGSATAVDASDVVLLNDDLHQLSWLFNKSKETGRVVKQNISLALAVILFVTTPALLGLVPLWLAVILHEGLSLIHISEPTRPY